MKSLRERFEAKVQKTDGCWLWNGAVMSTGYGAVLLKSSGRKKHTGLAHRVAWELYVGPIPEGLHVLHHCDCRLCTRIDHLFLGTNYDNVQDMMSKGRNRQPTGQRNGRAKLSDMQVSEIKQALSRGVTQAAVARALGVHNSQISRISTGSTWRKAAQGAAD
jgi:hypothetical protein